MKRAVLLDPGQSTPRMAAFEYALLRGFQVVCVAGQLGDAMHEIVAGRADVILALRASDLRPLVRIVTEPDGDIPQSQRRPQRRVRRSA